jgi:enterochelin esterase-like enzyme
VFSPGPDAAPRIAEANRELLAGQKKAGWMLLFDGQTLDGWKASEDPASFTVRDGMIVAHAVGTAIKGQAPHPKSHLFYVGPDGHASFTDFEFQADVMTEPESNSGVYFHTQFIENDWPQKGFEVQINSYKNEKRKTGGLYKVVDITEALVPNNEWFRLHVIVRGKRVIIQLNGKTAVDWTEPEGFVVRDPPWFSERKLSSGTFALQAHDPKSTVYFKNIRVKLLDKPPATDPAQQGGDITNGLVSHWTMDEGTGKVAKDRISGNHGVFEKGEPAWVKGRIGDGELEFTESCFLNCGKHESLNMTKAMTFAAWIKKAKDGRKSRIASRHGFIKEQGEQPGNAGWLVLCGGPQKVNIEWGLSTTGEDWHTGFTTPNSFPYGQWNHLAVTYDGAVMRAYINGVEDTGGDFPRKVGGSIHVSSAEMLLGQDRAYGPKFGGPKTWSFTGTIDDARLYNRALSAEDVRALFAQGEQPSNKPALEETWVNPPKEVIPGVEHRSFHSASMLRGVGYNIYLPPGYSQATDRRYPVIYHLHGFGNTESHHLRNITILDEAIRKGDVPPVILVYAFGGRTSFYADSPDKTVMSETCIVKELIPHVDKTYRTIAAREGRAIHGWSMGGSGALKFAFKHPELFGSAVAYGPGMTDSDTMKAKYSAVLHKMFAGDVRRYEEEAFWTWMRKNADRARGQVAVRVVVGTKDVSLGDSRKIHALLGELNFPHDYEEVPDVPHDPMKLYPLAGLRSFQFSAQQFK